MSRRHRLFALAGVAAAALVPALLAAQINYFGENKIQYRDFDWRVLRGPHVSVYYYPEEAELARVALTYAEESYTFLVGRFGHAPSKAIPLILYASHADFEQTNVLPFVPPEGLLGVTDFMKRRVTLPFTGSYYDFLHTIRHELVHAFQLSILTETYARHPRAHHVAIPDWWTEGLAEFWSAGEDSRDKMILRALTVDGQMPSLQQLDFVQGGVVYPLGGALHRWLAREFGAWRVQVFYRDIWKYDTFEQALSAVYGVPFRQLSARARDAFRREYYPSVNERRSLDVTAQRLAELAIKPAAVVDSGGSARRYLYLSPRSGYMNVYEAPLDGRGPGRAVVHGERTAQFESFHTFASRMDVRDGVVVFTSKYLERDALFFWDLKQGKVVGRYQFPKLISILSPTWAPDGRSVAFSGLSIAGYADLYVLHLPGGRLERLTRDRYDDADPSYSPDGRRIVFTSDRTAFGSEGAHNLFILNTETHALTQLTYGPWTDETPRWASNGRIYFDSDRQDSIFDIYSVDSLGNGRRETATLTGVFDPQWIPGAHTLLFDGFGNLTYNIYRQRPGADSAQPFAFSLPAERRAPGWTWPELQEGTYARANPTPYTKRFTLDFAAGDAIVAPGVGSMQGALFLFSDLLEDHLFYLTLTSFQGDGVGGFLNNINGSIFYLNQKRRLNWGVGAFRLRGLFYEGDFQTIYDETSYGGFLDLRWPFSRYSRVEGQFRLEHSNRFDLVGGNPTDPRRVGWLASNYLSLVKDNSLWLESGPIDGERRNVTAGVTNDLSNGRFDSWLVTLDERRYFRLASRTAYAVRAFGYYGAGARPRRINIGGPWGLRGYPRWGNVAGTRAFLINQEVRFPISNFLSIGFPFGEIRFPGVQGAIFADVGGAWDPPPSPNRGVLGSAGFSLRMPVFPPFVLRLDIGDRFEFGPTSGYSLSDPANGRGFVSFFFGYNY